MLRTLLNNFHHFVFIFFCIALSMVLVVTILAAKKYFFPRLVTTEHNDMCVVLVRVLSALYAILLSLTVVALVNGYESANLSLVREANAYSAVIEGTAALPEVARVPIQNALKDYVQKIVTVEWQAMRDGGPFPIQVNDAIQQVFIAIAAYSPQNDTERLFQGEILTRFNNGLDLRAQRWVYAHNNADNIVKEIIFINALALLTMTCMLGSVKPRAQLALTLLANSVVFAAFSLVMILDYPFSGELAITPESFHQLYHLYGES